MPPYSPNPCLIKRLWKFLKKKVIKNKYYETFDEFFSFVFDFFSLENWEKIKPELKSLLSLKFEIIQQTQYNELRLYIKFLQPSIKMKEKIRIESKYKRKYDGAETPFQRILESPDISKEKKNHRLSMILLILYD